MVGTIETDRVIDDIEAFFTTEGDYGNFINNPLNYSTAPISVLKGDFSNFANLLNSNVNKLVSNERNGKSTTLRWDTKALIIDFKTGLPFIRHDAFGAIYNTILMSYFMRYEYN